MLPQLQESANPRDERMCGGGGGVDGLNGAEGERSDQKCPIVQHFQY